MVVLISTAMTLVGLSFVPLSPLVILANILLIREYKNSDYERLLYQDKKLVSFIMISILGIICIIVSCHLPYRYFYPNIIRRLCEVIGTINFYFVIKKIVTKNR